MRPKQWIKNTFVFAPLVFDVKLDDPYWLGRSVAGFVLLCLTSGAIYIINDLVDAEKDRQHPRKRDRPVASGSLGLVPAAVASIAILVVALAAAYLLDVAFGGFLTAYVVLQIAYSLALKSVVIVDVMAIAAGFVLRVASGVALVRAERFSPWLYVSMTLLALLIGFGKRRHELTLLQENASAHREILQEYNLPLLDQVITVVTASALVAYALYTFLAENLPRDYSMMLTVPFILYSMFRYLYLIHVKGKGGAPEEIVMTDRPLQVAVALWALSVVLVMYGPKWLS
jgi:4-hydroxybenzoate polyprenyltransferase